MPQIIRTVQTRAARTFKVVVASCSAGAALVTVLSFAQSHGLINQPPVANAANGKGGSGSSAEAAWLGVSPTIDSAASIGDTVHLTARVADARGGTVVGAAIAWSSDSTEIATVSSDGTVVARAPGTVTIFAAVGAHIARSRITVRQRVVGARILSDSGLRLMVGQRRKLREQALDGRGHPVERRPAVWAVSDSAIARIDSGGTVVAVAPGRTAVSLTIEGVSVRSDLEVVDIPASIAAVSTAAQTAAAGTPLTRPIEVEVLSASGRPVAGMAVRFGADGGDGRTDPATVQTDARGRARARWTLGDAPGRQSLPVMVEGLATPVVVYAEAEPVAANLRSLALNDSATGRAGEEIPAEVGLRLTDSLGRALPGVPVSWTASDGGSAVAAEPRTDSLGQSRVRWTLGPKVGRQRAYATIGAGRSIPRATIAAVAVAGAPANAVVVGGAGQSGVVGAPLAKSIALRVVDRHDNPVPGVTVSLLPAHGTVADSALMTDSTGMVRAGWTLGRAAGPQRLVARVAGVVTPVTLGARARALGAANIAFPDSAVDGVVGKALSGPVSVTVTDAYGNPVPDVLVLFKSQSGAVSSARVMTDGEGHAATHWRLGYTAGEQRLTASTKGVESQAMLTVQAAPATVLGAAPPTATAASATTKSTSKSTAAKSPTKSTTKSATKSATKSTTSKAATKKTPSQTSTTRSTSAKTTRRH